jgi:hypothetical protein
MEEEDEERREFGILKSLAGPTAAPDTVNVGTNKGC